MSEKFKGKAACCIELLQILNTGRIYKVSELASLLEVNPRNITEYIKELKEVSINSSSGFYIETIPGRYGGYKLNGRACIPSLRFTSNETKAIDEAVDYLSNRVDFPKKEEFIKAISKIYSSISKNTFVNDLSIINRFPLVMPEEEINYRYNTIQEAIFEKKALILKYISLKNVEKEHIYHPYDMFMYNNSWFVIGWCESYNDVTYFKLNRITTIEKTNKKFAVYKYYNKNDFIDEYGFKNNGDWYHVEFIAKDQYASLVKERIYGKNQEVITIDDKQTLVKVDMQNKENILVFILGFNTKLEVLEPDWLKDELLNYSNYLEEIYKKSN